MRCVWSVFRGALMGLGTGQLVLYESQRLVGA